MEMDEARNMANRERMADAKYSIVACRDFVPEPLRFWLYLAFVLVFQFSGGVYLALAPQMMETRGLLREDVAMAAYASFVGMTVVFPILFPIKFRFTGKSTLIFCALGLALCNAITMHAGSMAVLVPTCFVAGVLRMVGTFEANSTIQLKVTPTRDFAVFFPFLYLVILGMIPLSGIVAGRIAYLHGWQSVHRVVIGLLLGLVSCCVVFLRHVRMPSHGPTGKIDWAGGALWSLFLLLTIFVLEYGGRLGWFGSGYVRAAAAGALLVLLAIRWRNSKTTHPYLDSRALGYPNVWTMLALFAAMCILMAPGNALQNAYTEGVLHWGIRTNLSLNWAILVGTVCGVAISYFALAKAGIGYRSMTIFGFILLSGYLAGMYLLVSPDTTRAVLFVPLALRGAGYATLCIALCVYASRTIPFLHFFHVLAFFGFVHTDIGSSLGSTVTGHLLSARLHANAASMGAALDGRNPLAASMPLERLVETFHGQVLLVSIKQAYGLMTVLGLLVVLVAMATRYRGVVRFKMPRW